MALKILILGATGNVGRATAKAALSTGQRVTLLARSPEKLDPAIAGACQVIAGDLVAISAADLADILRGHDAVVTCAGNIEDGPSFNHLIDKIVTAVESLLPGASPVCWFFAGAGILEVDNQGHTALDIPFFPTKYRGHWQNYQRLLASPIDWRLCCPGPMVQEPGIGLGRLIVTRDTFPVSKPSWLPLALALPFFARAVGRITVPYEDVAAMMLANAGPANDFSRCRVGLALPAGMTKTKRN